VTDARDVSAAAARRFLVLRHLLAPPRSLPPGPESVLRVFDRIGVVQFDPLEVAGRNHDVTLLARVEGYRREHADELLYERRALYETYNKSLNLVPTAELPYYRLGWDAYAASERVQGLLAAQADLVEELADARVGGGALGQEAHHRVELRVQRRDAVQAVPQQLHG
jgi:uncharacterized protein YcaQ